MVVRIAQNAVRAQRVVAAHLDGGEKIMIDEPVDAEGPTESRISRQAAANATDDGMRVAEDDEKAVEQSTECSPETEVIQQAQTDSDS